MPRIVFTASASEDEANILDERRTRGGTAAASKLRTAFSACYDRLAAWPDSGASRPALGPDIRIGIVGPYLIIYRHTAGADTLTVLRILHGRQHITATALRAGG